MFTRQETPHLPSKSETRGLLFGWRTNKTAQNVLDQGFSISSVPNPSRSVTTENLGNVIPVFLVAQASFSTFLPSGALQACHDGTAVHITSADPSGASRPVRFFLSANSSICWLPHFPLSPSRSLCVCYLTSSAFLQSTTGAPEASRSSLMRAMFGFTAPALLSMLRPRTDTTPGARRQQDEALPLALEIIPGKRDMGREIYREQRRSSCVFGWRVGGVH